MMMSRFWQYREFVIVMLLCGVSLIFAGVEGGVR